MGTDIQLPDVKPLLESPEITRPHLPTAKEKRVEEVNEALGEAYRKAGTLVITDSEATDLTAPFEDTLCEKRPHDGLWYIPHIHISDRLTRVFGPGQWTMIRRWESIEGNMIYAEWVMIVRGVYIGESVGASEYHPTNRKQNFSDVLEATRGEAIRRICAKYLSCGSQVWSPTFKRIKPPGPSTKEPDSKSVRDLAKKLWAMLPSNVAGKNPNWKHAKQFLVDEALIDPEEHGGDDYAPALTAERYEQVIAKTKEKMS